VKRAASHDASTAYLSCIDTLRLSVGWGTRAAEIEYVLEKLPKLVRRVRESVAPR